MGSRRLPDEVETMISGAIEEFYKSLQQPSINAMQKEVRRRCSQRCLRPPCRTTLRDRVAAIDPADLVAPCPFSDGLLSSWISRVATRFGLEVPQPDLREATAWTQEAGGPEPFSRGLCAVAFCRQTAAGLPKRGQRRIAGVCDRLARHRFPARIIARVVGRYLRA